MPASPSRDDQSSQAQSSPSPHSPAAIWLAAFSPMRSDSIVQGYNLEDGEVSKDSGSDGGSLSPAAQYLTRFSSPPPYPKPLATVPNGNIAEYSLGDPIGRGISQVRLATSVITGAVVAVKIVPHATTLPGSVVQSARLKSEERIWSVLNHEHILPLLSVLQTAELTAFFALYCPDGSLLDLLERQRHVGGEGGLEGDLVRSIFRQIVRGIAYLHNTMQIVHGDIKLENILIDDNGNVRVADFGCAQYVGGFAGALGNTRCADDVNTHISQPMSDELYPHLSSTVYTLPQSAQGHDTVLHGSLPYASPELLQRPSSILHHHLRNLPRDIWALGCVLHALLTGSLPFSDAYEPRLYVKILKGEWEPQSSTSDGDRVILKGCLCVDPITRWTINEVEAHAHEIGTAAYARLQCRTGRPHSRVHHVQLSTSSHGRPPECRSSQDCSPSTTQGVSSEPIDIPPHVVDPNDAHLTACRKRSPRTTDGTHGDSVELISSQVRWALPSESRDTASLGTQSRSGRSSYGRTSRERQMESVGSRSGHLLQLSSA